MIKELQTELMTGQDLPHVVSVRLLARLDEAERHLPLPQAGTPDRPNVGANAGEEKAGEVLEEVK